MDKLKKIKEYCPVWCCCLFLLAAVCLVINLVSLASEAFSDRFNGGIAAFFRLLLSKITGWLPFSLGETVVICMPILAVLLIIKAFVLVRGERKRAIRYLCGLLSVCTLFYSLFVLTFSTAYRGSAIDEKMGLEKGSLSTEELRNTAQYLLEESNILSDEIAFSKDGCSRMGYSLRELNEKLNDAYIVAAEKYHFIQKMRSNVKRVAFSELMSYTHITGVYTYYTGEANINYKFPDYTLPYTMAHEMAHQRGIAREDEANFVAFLVCLESDDAYIRYSAYLNMYEYMANALYSADAKLYSEVAQLKCAKLESEHRAYAEFFEKYRESSVSEVAGAVNDTYLNSQGQDAGTKSYGLVVELTVAYYKSGALT